MEEIKYKINEVHLKEDERWFNYLEIRRISRFINWKFDKFVSMEECECVLEWAVIDEKEKNSVMNKAEQKRLKKEKLENSILNSVLLEM